MTVGVLLLFLARGVVGRSAVCDCGISLSYSLTVLMKSALTARPLANLAQLVIVFSYGCLRVIYKFVI